MSGNTFKDVMTNRAQSFESAADAYQFLTGKTLSEDEAAETLWYERLRRRMIAARKEGDKNQAEIARSMDTSQSEVSRLENGLGPGTRLGTLRGYLSACGTSLEELIGPEGGQHGTGLPDDSMRSAPTVTGQTSVDDPFPSRDTSPDTRTGSVTPSKKAMRLVIEGQEFVGVEAIGILESLHAVNNLLCDGNINPVQRKEIILGFLRELSKIRSGAAKFPSHAVDVHIDVRQLYGSATPPESFTHGFAGMAGRVFAQSDSVSDLTFRRDVAEPLKLVGF